MRRSAECVWSGAVKPGLNLWKAPWGPLAGSPQATAIMTSALAGFGTHFISLGVMVTRVAALAAGFALAAPVFAPSAKAARAKRTTMMDARMVLRVPFITRLL